MAKIKRLFIANRGEIARRIAVSAKKRGIETVALTKNVTPPAFLTDLIDQFIHVPDETSATYLDADLMVALAKKSGANAVHPGFGFLSENAGFAQAVRDAGLIWIGPSPEAIAAMASKEAARQLAEKSGVPVVPALKDIKLSDNNRDHDALLQAARKIGYPLLIKAALGGGGKGMRLVHKEEDLLANARLASSEALSSFGDGTILVEKYLPAPRHVEVQILGDESGQVFAIGDRDCSVQRRHQKIIEEAPAPGLLPETRKALHTAAINLAKAVNYTSAGTVEFLLDWSDKARASGSQPFYFLEMNTRLQVEHPVTEEVFGLDLVECQFRIAEGEELPAGFGDLRPRGHSFEARIYAEDVHNNFFPAPGDVYGFVPCRLPGIRWEIGLDTVDVITADFDPMVSKIVATGATRQEAAAAMLLGLSQTILVGPAHNIPLLSAIFNDALFQKEPVTTHYIQDHADRLLAEKTGQGPNDLHSLLGKIKQRSQVSVGLNGLNVAARTQAIFGRTAAKAGPDCDIIVSQENQHQSRSGHVVVKIGHGLARAVENRWEPFYWVDARRPEFRQIWVGTAAAKVTEHIAYSEELTAARAGTAKGDIVAPVPGKVKRILVKDGEDVDKNQTVLVLESMKMEFEVLAPRAGKIGTVNVSEGLQVDADDLLMAWQQEG